jgi:DNA-binding transcriptional LysR family regulator
LDGQELAELASRVEEDVLALARHADARDRAVVGTVRLTTATHLAAWLLVPALGALREAHPGLVLEIAIDAQRPDKNAAASWRLERARGGAFGLVHSPFVIGGDDDDDLIIKRWPAHALRFHVAQGELYLEPTVAKVTRSVQLNGHTVRADDTTAANELESMYGRTGDAPGRDGNASADAQENSWPNWEKMLSALQKLVETG